MKKEPEYVWSVCGVSYTPEGSQQMPERLFKRKTGAESFLAELRRDALGRGQSVQEINGGLLVFPIRNCLVDLYWYYIDKEPLIDTCKEGAKK